MLQIVKRKLIKFITKFYDPLVEVSIGKECIRAPLSHSLKDIIRLYPDYNFNLARIVTYVNTSYPSTTLIDIGANIGDTVAYIRNYNNLPILCIDGDSKFIGILKGNISQYSDVYVCQALVGNESKDVNLKIVTERGTGHIEHSKDVTPMRRLEDILLDFPIFKNSKILKSDTDGFDTIILRSCSNYLRQIKPILFFEFDPHLIKKNNDDPFEFINFLSECGYQYFIFYTNIGDFLLPCDINNQRDIIFDLVHYFSGRSLDLFADICAFPSSEKQLFELTATKELEHFKKARNY